MAREWLELKNKESQLLSEKKVKTNLPQQEKTESIHESVNLIELEEVSPIQLQEEQNQPNVLGTFEGKVANVEKSTPIQVAFEKVEINSKKELITKEVENHLSGENSTPSLEAFEELLNGKSTLSMDESGKPSSIEVSGEKKMLSKHSARLFRARHGEVISYIDPINLTLKSKNLQGETTSIVLQPSYSDFETSSRLHQENNLSFSVVLLLTLIFKRKTLKALLQKVKSKCKALILKVQKISFKALEKFQKKVTRKRKRAKLSIRGGSTISLPMQFIGLGVISSLASLIYLHIWSKPWCDGTLLGKFICLGLNGCLVPLFSSFNFVLRKEAEFLREKSIRSGSNLSLPMQFIRNLSFIIGLLGVGGTGLIVSLSWLDFFVFFEDSALKDIMDLSILTCLIGFSWRFFIIPKDPKEADLVTKEVDFTPDKGIPGGSNLG